MLLDEHLHLPELINYPSIYLSWIAFIAYHIRSVFLLCWCDEKGSCFQFYFSQVSFPGYHALPCHWVWSGDMSWLWTEIGDVPQKAVKQHTQKKPWFQVMVSKVQTGSGNTAPWRPGPFARSSRGKHFISTLAHWFYFKRP